MQTPTGSLTTPPATGPLRAERLVAAFGLFQVSLFLGSAIYRVAPFAVEPWADGTLSHAQQLLVVAWVLVSLYTEGYRGFHMRFCPRVVSRAAQLGRDPKPLDLLLALPFCLSLIRAERKQLIGRWTFVVGLYTLIFFVRMLPQPWRGIVDAGVLVGLAWGLVGLWWFYALYVAGKLRLA